jgi:Helix-turn-helix domain
MVKMSVNIMALVFSANMPELKTDDGKTVPDTTAKFVLLAMADNASEDGENCYSGIRKLCQKTNFSTATVCNALNALRNNGFIELVGKSKVDTNNYTVKIDRLQPLKFQPLKHGDSSGYNPSVLATETKPSLNHQIKPSPLSIENAIAVNQPIADTSQDSVRYIAPREFEKALQFSKMLPWWSNKKWSEFGEWVCERYNESTKCFEEYQTWRNTPFTKGGISNQRLRGFPAEFYDSWDMFVMSRNPKTDEVRPAYKDAAGVPVTY